MPASSSDTHPSPTKSLIYIFCMTLNSFHTFIFSYSLVKFEENDAGNWVFGNTTRITALDAECLPDLNLIITVDTNFSLSLYTGLTKVAEFDFLLNGNTIYFMWMSCN